MFGFFSNRSQKKGAPKVNLPEAIPQDPNGEPTATRRKSVSLAAGSTQEQPKSIQGVGNSIGFFSNHGVEKSKAFFGLGTGRVGPKVNQDCVFVTPGLCGREDTWLFAVYDGNGPMGEVIAEATGTAVTQDLEGNPEALFVSDPSTFVKATFATVNAKICEKKEASKSGTTATTVMLKGAKVLCANVGDTRALRLQAGEKGAWTIQRLTSAHKPDDTDERKRIEAAGGFVFSDSKDYGAARVFNTANPLEQMVAWASMLSHSSSDGVHAGGLTGMDKMDMSKMGKPWPGLAMSRVFGHSGVTSIGIIAEPDIVQYEMTSSDKAIVICSDGVWDFVTDEEACDIVKKHSPDATAACKELVELASQRWTEDDPTYRDDISAIVVYVPLKDVKVTAKTTVYTTNSEAAVEEKKKNANANEDLEYTTAADPATPAAAEPGPAAASKSAGSKKVPKATKEQRRRSVVTKYG